MPFCENSPIGTIIHFCHLPSLQVIRAAIVARITWLIGIQRSGRQIIRQATQALAILVQSLASQEPVCPNQPALKPAGGSGALVIFFAALWKRFIAAPVSFIKRHSFLLRLSIPAALLSPPAARRLCSPAKPPAACRAIAATGPRVLACHATAHTVRPGITWPYRTRQPVALAAPFTALHFAHCALTASLIMCNLMLQIVCNDKQQ